nr:hypothetical protein [Pseudomonas baltica]
MRRRGPKFWTWADCQLHYREHEERLSDGALIDVQVRLSRDAVTQLFIGVYASDGRCCFEEFYPARLNESMTVALAWGVEQARIAASREKTQQGRSTSRARALRQPHSR